MKNNLLSSGRLAWIVALATVLLQALARPAGAQLNLHGLSGAFNTPSAEVLGDGWAEIGYNSVPKHWAWDSRGLYRNDAYFGTVGFLPRVEVSFRVTTIPGFRKFAFVDSLSTYTDADRMLSGKVQLLKAGEILPDVAFGLEDVSGTHRFHAEYLVAGRGFDLAGTRVRLDAGWSGAALSTNGTQTLQGGFAGMEVRPARFLAFVAEYDTEKWNLGFKLRGPFGVTGRLVWLHGTDPSGGFGLSMKL